MKFENKQEDNAIVRAVKKYIELITFGDLEAARILKNTIVAAERPRG